MSWWNTLGVSADADERTIKRAYSQLIKQYRPDEEPQRFSEIRQAFEAARHSLKNAKSQQTIAQPVLPPMSGHPSSPLDDQLDGQLREPLSETEAGTSESSANLISITSQEQAENSLVVEPELPAKPIEDVLMDMIVRWRQKGEKYDLLAEIRALPQLSNFDQFNRASAFMLDWLVNRIFLQGDKAFLYKRDFIQSLERQFSWTSTEVQWAQQYPQHDLRPLIEVFHNNSAPNAPQADNIQNKSNPRKVLWSVFFRILMAIWLWGLTKDGWAEQNTLQLAGAGFLWFIWLEATFTNYWVIRKVSSLWGKLPYRPLHLAVFWVKWAIAGLLASVIGSVWYIGLIAIFISSWIDRTSHVSSGDWHLVLNNLLQLIVFCLFGFFVSRWINRKLNRLWSEFRVELERYY